MADADAALGAGVDTTTDPNAPAFFDPEWLEDVVWVTQRVNKHSLTNKWLTVDSSRCFELLMKERSAMTAQQCRILVRGAAHLPLQLSSGTSVQFLYPTWQYLKVLEAAGAVPAVPAARYREVEEWMLQHIREFQDSRLADASTRPMGEADRPLSTDAKSTPTGSATPTAAPAAATGVRSRVRDMFRRSKNTNSQGAESAIPNGAATSAAAPAPPTVSPLAAPAAQPAETPPQTSGDSSMVTTPALRPAIPGEIGQQVQPVKVSKKKAVADFIRRKLHRQDPTQSTGMDDSVTESDEDEASLPPLPTAAAAAANQCEESLEAFSLSFAKVRRMWIEFRDDAGHATFDRLFRRRRATTKWQYEYRDAIFQRIKSNRTVTIMVIVGAYTALMHVVPFDVFCLLLLALELWTFYLCENYRNMAIDFGRRAARTRVDRMKDWFFFGVTRRKARPSGPGGAPVVILDEDL